MAGTSTRQPTSTAAEIAFWRWGGVVVTCDRLARTRGVLGEVSAPGASLGWICGNLRPSRCRPGPRPGRSTAVSHLSLRGSGDGGRHTPGPLGT